MGRRWLVSLLTAAGVAAGGCGTAQPRAVTTAAAVKPTTSTAAAKVAPTTAASSTGTAASSVSVAATSSRAARRRPRPDPGTLPQTRQLPSAATPAFRVEMADLWLAIRRGTLGPGLPAFFPEAAYVQVKAISDAGSDYRDRLLGDYGLDISAAHELLGSDPAAARLIEVKVPGTYAHWVPPDACYNRIGYWEVPNSRVVYRAGGQLRSFGIASMISWRGVWYVVHLGAVVRDTAAGVVDDPAVGTGESAPSSTC